MPKLSACAHDARPAHADGRAFAVDERVNANALCMALSTLHVRDRDDHPQCHAHGCAYVTRLRDRAGGHAVRTDATTRQRPSARLP